MTARVSPKGQPLKLFVVDFFCGAGGFTCGALMAGAHVVCGIDCDPRAKKTYEHNNRNGEEQVPFVEARIEQLEPGELAGRLKPFKGQPLLFIGCPPCQPFTNLRTSKERSSSSLDALRGFIDHVLDLKPDYVIVENVPGIQAKKYGNLWEESRQRLSLAGYRIRSEIVNAARYGVPQKRLRTILVGSLHGEPPWPKPTHEPADFVGVKTALEQGGLLCGQNLCTLEAGGRCTHDTLHQAARLSELNLNRIKAITQPGGGRKCWPAELDLRCYRNHDGHTDVYGRMYWDRPAPTLTTRFVSLSNGRFGHPEQNRALTPREGALLQSFRPTYQFYAEKRDINVIHIGNAVPPKLGQAFVSAVAADALARQGA